MNPTSTTALTRAEEPGQHPSSRILIIDDRSEKQLMLEAALAPLGREIVTTGSGRDALRWLLSHDCAVILLDVNMPGMDGFETARMIRQRPRNRQTPIIFVTAYGDDLHALEGYSLGAVDFILSPVVPEVLRSKVGVLLELQECTIEIRQQAERLREQARQLQALTRASLAIHAEPSIDRILQIGADAAREIIDSEFACAVLATDQAGIRERQVAVSTANADIKPADVDPAFLASQLAVASSDQTPSSSHASLRLSASNGHAVQNPITLSASLRGRDGQPMGSLVVAGKRDAAFNQEDEALLLQLAQMSATAIENTMFAEAREANRIKDEFLATLSHELRTPLSAILGWSQLLRTHTLDAEETVEALEIIERNGEMQHKLIEDLLDVSRIVTGKMQLTMRPISLTDVIQAAVKVMLPAAQAKHVTINVQLDEQADRISGDADRLQQVLWNLLSNAVKFTPTRGRVDVRLEADGGQSRLCVRDSGEGIESEFLPYIFDRFRQADSSNNRRHGGLGIGLAIVRHVVELHGGTVRGESKGRGQGTEIILTLPRTPLEVDVAQELPRSYSEGERPIQTPQPVGQL